MYEVASGRGSGPQRTAPGAALLGNSMRQWFTTLGFIVPLPKVPVLTATLCET